MLDGKDRVEISESRTGGLLELDGNLVSDKFGLAVNLIGAFCALVGLIEITRLISFYWETYGLLANFPLEMTIYAIGIAWIFIALVNFLTSDSRFLEVFRK